MTTLAPFKTTFTYFQSNGYTLVSSKWTTHLKRHVGCVLKKSSQRYFAKLAIAKQPDLDEPNMLEGMRREVWWSRTIQTLRQYNSEFPFTSPRIVETNVTQEPFQEEVAWVIFEYINGRPIVEWEPDRSNRKMNSVEVERFNRLFDAIINSLVALEKVNLHTLNELGLPPLPSPPHGMRRAQRKGLLNMETAVLGNGAFEIKNFWQDTQGRLVILDNEFAGLYPKYDHLAYLYHRLYCNTMRPDLAKRLLSKYIAKAIQIGNSSAATNPLQEFWQSFTQILRPRAIGGWYYDTFRRQFMPWHKKQVLRYKLLWSLLCGHHGKLASD